MTPGNIYLMDLTEFAVLCLSILPSSTIKASYVHVLDHNNNGPDRHFEIIRAAMSQFPTCLIGTFEEGP